MFELVIVPFAEDDISEIALWYEKQRKGLGADFLLALEADLSSILRNPLATAVQKSEFRRSVMMRFPYGINYRIDNSKIVVVADWHFSRKPWSWRKRYKK